MAVEILKCCKSKSYQSVKLQESYKRQMIWARGTILVLGVVEEWLN